MTDAKSNDAMCSTKSLTPNEYDASRFNALRHAILSQFAVLPWEDPVEYETLVAALTEEHKPSGPTETHLVVELAGVLWRKRRLRQAEVAAVGVADFVHAPRAHATKIVNPGFDRNAVTVA